MKTKLLVIDYTGCSHEVVLLSALKAIKHNKTISSIKLVGCNTEQLKGYIEGKFKSGMTWLNHGYGRGCWHLDHIMPCSVFDLIKEEEQYKCFHYTNLQPLWAEENFAKGSKLNNNGSTI